MGVTVNQFDSKPYTWVDFPMKPGQIYVIINVFPYLFLHLYIFEDGMYPPCLGKHSAKSSCISNNEDPCPNLSEHQHTVTACPDGVIKAQPYLIWQVSKDKLVQKVLRGILKIRSWQIYFLLHRAPVEQP